MTIKNMLLTVLFTVGGAMQVNSDVIRDEAGQVIDITNPLSSGLEVLDTFEINKLIEYQDKHLTDEVIEKFSDISEYKFSDKEMMIVQRFMGKIMGLGLRIGMTINQLDERCDDERNFALETNKAVLNIIETDPEFTDFVKFPLIYVSKKAEELICSQGDLDDLGEHLIGYAPEVKDAVTALLEYDVWSRAYLKQEYAHNGVVTVHDVITVVKWLANFFEFPEQSKQIWFDYLSAVEKGAQKLPQDVHTALNETIVSWLENGKYDDFVTLAIETNNLRKELTQKAQVTPLTQVDLDQYGSALDKVFEQGNMFEGSIIDMVKQASNKLPLYEKLIFKN